MITSRGCPYNCLFCDSHLTWGRKVRFRSAGNVVDEISMLVDTMGIKELIFYDDTFTLLKKRSDEICRSMRKEKMDLSWGCLSRVDRIDKSTVSLMKKTGCHMMSFGIESGSQKMLEIMRKGINLDQAIAAMKLVRKERIDSTASFVLGIPGETKETMLETIEFAKRLNPTYALFFRAIPFPGTDLYFLGKSKGLIKNFDWENYTEDYTQKKEDPLLRLDNMTEEEFSRLLHKAHREFYLRPGKVLEFLPKMTTWGSIKAYSGAFKTFLQRV
jgi:anaerobic magnesium-protoporphyrin IX monomethyl ester cyclase